MPPPAILRDVVQQIADKLSQRGCVSIPAPLAKIAREQLRILQTRVAVGKLGQHDRAERRAAVVIEYVVRQHLKTTISEKDLCAVSGLKQVSHWRMLHTTVGNYLFTQPTSSTSQQQLARRRSNNTSSGTTRRVLPAAASRPDLGSLKRRKLRSTAQAPATAHQASTSRITDLCIRLAAVSLDIHAWARQTVRLWTAIQNHVANLPAVHERRGYLYDLQRYRAAYEAACLYYTAQNRNDNKGRRSKTGGGGGDDDDGRPLQLGDLVQGSSDFTYLELQQVYPSVVQWAEQIADQERLINEKAVNGLDASKTAATSKTTAKPRSKPRSKTAKDSAASTKPTARRDNHDAPPLEDSTDFTLQDQPLEDVVTFEEWKEQILEQALDQARDVTADTELASREALLERAANAVLRKYDLMPLQ